MFQLLCGVVSALVDKIKPMIIVLTMLINDKIRLPFTMPLQWCFRGFCRYSFLVLFIVSGSSEKSDEPKHE